MVLFQSVLPNKQTSRILLLRLFYQRVFLNFLTFMACIFSEIRHFEASPKGYNMHDGIDRRAETYYLLEYGAVWPGKISLTSRRNVPPTSSGSNGQSGNKVANSKHSVCELLPDNTASHPWRQYSRKSPL
jgi:hypothetical protein